MQYVPIGIIIGGILLLELFTLYGSWQFAPNVDLAAAVPDLPEKGNTEQLGALLYTDYVFAFQVAGLILLVAMIGAIVLTHRTRPGVRKQKVQEQFDRSQEDSMEIKKVASGSGV